MKQGVEKETNTWDHNDVGSREKYKTNWINTKLLAIEKELVREVALGG